MPVPRPPSAGSDPSPGLSHPSPSPLFPPRTFGRTQSQQLATALDVDLTLPTAISHLVTHLLQPLTPHYSPSTLSTLRTELSARLESLYSSTWEEDHPQHGSGRRSLICTKAKGLPPPIKEVAEKMGISANAWRAALNYSKMRREDDEWEAWCDPGAVVWRFGGWEWEDVGFEPFKVNREQFQVIWQGGASESASPALSQQVPTPVRPSHAIPIRAPTVYTIPATPAQPPAHNIFPPSPLDGREVSRRSSPMFDSASDPDNLSSAFNSQSELGLGPAPAFHRSTSPSPSDTSNFSNPHGNESRFVSDSSVNSIEPHDEPTHPHSHDYTRPAPSRGSHRGSESLSSVASSASESNSGHTQLLTPASRPGSADPFNVNVPHLSIRDTQVHNHKDKDSSDSDREMTRMRKITPPMLALRGRTPSPHTPDHQSSSSAATMTPGTETTITPNSILPPTPSVTPYDGGNVTVLGGGVKLGGGGGSAAGSRSVSSMSHRSTSGGNPIDRSRSPSVSLASRALNTAMGPGDNGELGTSGGVGGGGGGGRKQRTRRRIMPTYLGHLGQPGVGGPIMGVFGQFANVPMGKLPPPPPPTHPSSTFAAPHQHVGVGVSPPPAQVMTMGTLRSSSAGSQTQIQRMTS